MGPARTRLRGRFSFGELVLLIAAVGGLRGASVNANTVDNDTIITTSGSHDFQDVLTNQTPTSGSLALDKIGSESTTYAATPSDDGLTVIAGGSIAGGPQTEHITVQLVNNANGSGTSGEKSWTVTIDNTAASSAGAGMGSDDPDDTISVFARLLDPALLTGNAGSTLNSGSGVSVSNALGPYRSPAFVDSIAISPRWTLNNLPVGEAIVAGGGTPTASVGFDAGGLLNGQTMTGTLEVTFENDQGYTGATDGDLGTLSWNLEQPVSGNVGAGVADVAAGGSYANLSGTSDAELGSVATILAGSNSSGGEATVSMSWRDRGPTERWLDSDVLALGGTDGDIIVLELTYDDTLIPSGKEALWAANGEMCVYWYDVSGGQWLNAIAGNHGANVGVANFHGTWAEAGSPMELGAWGVDIDDNVVWAVIDHEGEFAPEPGTLALLLGGALVLLRRKDKS